MGGELLDLRDDAMTTFAELFEGEFERIALSIVNRDLGWNSIGLWDLQLTKSTGS